MYFDDAHITDKQSSGASAQWAFTEMNNLLGTPFAPDKKQTFAPQGTFLGLDFDFSIMAIAGCVTFWARERPLTKTQQMIQEAKQTGIQIVWIAQFPGKRNVWPSWMWRP